MDIFITLYEIFAIVGGCFDRYAFNAFASIFRLYNFYEALVNGFLYILLLYENVHRIFIIIYIIYIENIRHLL